MAPTDTRKAKDAAAGVRSARGGPRTSRGRSRSALNSIKHGLLASHVVLPGEDLGAYQAHLAAVIEAVSPHNAIEAKLASAVADLLWRQARLSRIETGLAHKRISELLGATEGAERTEALTTGISALGTALQAWEASLGEQPGSSAPASFKSRYKAMRAAVETVVEVLPGEPLDQAAGLNRALAVLEDVHLRRISPTETKAVADLKGGLESEFAAYAAVGMGARAWLARLLDQAQRHEAAQDEVRATLAAIALPDARDVARLGRYARHLQDGLSRTLAALEQARKMSKASVATDRMLPTRAYLEEHLVGVRVVT